MEDGDSEGAREEAAEEGDTDEEQDQPEDVEADLGADEEDGDNEGTIEEGSQEGDTEEEEPKDLEADSDEEEEGEGETGRTKLRTRGSNAAKVSDENDASVSKDDGDSDGENKILDSVDKDADSDERETNTETLLPRKKNYNADGEEETDADEDETDADGDEGDAVVDLDNLAPPVAGEDATGSDEDEDQLDVAADENENAGASPENATDKDGHDRTHGAEDEEESDVEEDEDEPMQSDRERWEDNSPEDLERTNDAPRGGIDISEAVKAYREENKANGRRPGAGAQKGKTIARDMDKWKELIAQKRQQYEKKEKGRLGRGKKEKGGQNGQQIDKAGATIVMKANTPGTAEYKDRMDKLLKKINKLRKRRGLPPMTSPIVGTKKSQQPLKKEVRKPRLPEKLPVVKRMFKMTEEEELILDASLSFVAGLKYGVFMSSDSLTTKQKDALKGWLDLMSVSLPPEWGLHSLIDELNDNTESISQSNENLLRILRKHLLPRRVWSPSCMRPGSPQGFSCGMWKLLHTSTVGIAEQRGGLNLVQAGVVDSGTRIFTPADAADTIREYLAHFFGCIECRNHFLAQYDQCSFRRCDRLTDNAPVATAEDWKQLALWLWEVHNGVSVHVAHERINREMESKNVKTTRFRMARLKRDDEIKHLYPSLEQCFQCFDEDGSWEEENVFEFLESTYWSKPDVTADRLLQYRGEEGSGSGFIWIFVIIVLAAIYMLRGRKVLGLQRTVNAALVTGRKTIRGTKKRSA